MYNVYSILNETAPARQDSVIPIELFEYVRLWLGNGYMSGLSAAELRCTAAAAIDFSRKLDCLRAA